VLIPEGPEGVSTVSGSHSNPPLLPPPRRWALTALTALRGFTPLRGSIYIEKSGWGRGAQSANPLYGGVAGLHLRWQSCVWAEKRSPSLLGPSVCNIDRREDVLHSITS